nr:hypothetical protein [uncultured Mucilaginibacter sp.]
MKKSLFLLLIIVTTFFAVKAQTVTADTSEVFTSVDELPNFAGGAEKYRAYIKKSVLDAKRKDNSPGFVVVVSTIEKDGSFTNLKAIKRAYPGGGFDSCKNCARRPQIFSCLKKWKTCKVQVFHINSI